jgi:hypothetical protein
LIAGSTNSTAAVRQPVDHDPLRDVLSNNITCNAKPSPASETVSVAAGDTIGFKILDDIIFHQGPAAMYLGTPPKNLRVSAWDGSGYSWFKVGLHIVTPKSVTNFSVL